MEGIIALTGHQFCPIMRHRFFRAATRGVVASEARIGWGTGIMTKAVEKQVSRKDWKKPELRAVVPASRTRGGGFDANDQDDVIYDAS
ncbi:MAG TPA: hypothetical protein PKD48_05430 [Sphingopyxis sp.]|nr:hypothetical protein [Sphingopyxis sp.]HMQ17885.1 hypothetical protein [Sphingopyxis sp.]